MFVDGNFEEDSKILDEPKSSYDNIDILLLLNNAEASMNMFNMPKEFASSFDRITNILPGDSKPIIINPKPKNKSKALKKGGAREKSKHPSF